MAVYRIVPAGDLALSGDSTTGLGNAGGALVVVEGLEQVRQRIAARLKVFQGEWFLDQRQGMPYYRDVFTTNPNLSLIRSLYRKAILSVPGVLLLPQLLLSFDRSNRKLSVAFQAVCNGGTITVEPGDDDFLVDAPLAS